MSEQVDAAEIERIVGVQRHATRHYARAVSAEQVVYILHSARCKDSRPDLRDCRFSLALDNGIDEGDWSDVQDRALRVWVDNRRRLIPVVPGMKFAPDPQSADERTTP